MLKDFGVIVACCNYDYLFAKGCVASIRYFLGDVPIALIVDGDVSTKALEKLYDVQVIRRETVTSKLLKERSFGMGLTKMVAFWESPWENFLYLDADTVIWGDVLQYEKLDQFDFISDMVRDELSDQHISSYFFNIDRINQFFPDFDWRKYRNYYFCTGAFFAKRGIFSLEEYEEILDLVEKEPNLFFVGEQGFLNLMMCRAAEENRIRLGQADLEFLVPDYSCELAQEAFPIEEAMPSPHHKSMVIHWCGYQKPTTIARSIYTEPMTFCRQQFLKDASSLNLKEANSSLIAEDLQYYVQVYRKRIKRKLKKVLAS